MKDFNSKEWRRENEILYGVWHDKNKTPKTLILEIYDKNGNVRSRLEFNEQMMLDLKQDIDMCLGVIKEEEDS